MATHVHDDRPFISEPEDRVGRIVMLPIIIASITAAVLTILLVARM